MSAPGSAARQPSALVTGAASGLGRSCVERLRAEGFAVAGLDLASTANEADLSLECDVTDQAEVADAVAEAVTQLGGLTGVAHCAGAFQAEALPVHAISPETWSRTITVNLGGAYAVARASLPALIESSGSLVFTASVAAGQPQPGAAAYAASKGGVNAFSRAIALEYAHLGVRSNTVSPGWMDTAMSKPVLSRPELRERVEGGIPLKRVASPDEVAAAVHWLISRDSSYLTGQELVIDGGVSVSAFVDRGDTDAVWRRLGPAPDDVSR